MGTNLLDDKRFGMTDYDVDETEVAISDLFNLEVGAELKAKGNKWAING